MLSEAMSISQTMLPEFDAEMESTRKILACVPEGKWDWKPHTKSMSLGVLTGHIADMPSWGMDTINKDSLVMEPGDFVPFIPTSTAELVERFEKDRPKFRELLATAGDEVLFAVWSMTWGGRKVIEMPRVAVLRGMVMNHMIHHRAQLGVYLRLLDVAIPGVYGPSADEMAAMATGQAN